MASELLGFLIRHVEVGTGRMRIIPRWTPPPPSP